MEMLVNNTYILNAPNKKKLKEFGFRYNKKLSGDDGNYYSLRFPTLRYHNSTTVDGEIIVDMNNGDIRLNAYSYGTNGYYPPFYQNDCSDVYKPIIKKINKAFVNMLEKVGIQKVK